ncbi:chlorophyll a/b-binding protein [Calothrix sp. UHCC 0171]|uniref:chlorophyll a/b-binding protein n=1 Tax=Calothrix sp. UHCC 0171 TaxID=3110245 RepID=UPI002B2113CB|nr:chlorophyll a/b-binding protein [Calothrix sp. UHCC 0171]MEA5574609.1 chlorophyll a/b-binding protein [Calothrix sp. UHCC 0171]
MKNANNTNEAKFGFTQSAEQLNGRLAMIGFIALIIREVVTGHGSLGFLTGL